jgi:protein associated with RNAse G/E
VIEQPQLMLFPVDAWWTAVFTAAPAPTEIYCDICTPPRWPQPGEVTMIDLDLDVIRRRADQRVVLLDEDEFAEHQRRYRYPAHVIARAQESAAWLQETIAAGAEPFGGDYLTWLDRIQ